MTNTELVLAMLAAWERRSVEDVLALLAPQVVWSNTGLPDAVGHAAVRSVAEPFIARSETIRFEVHAVAETAGGTVLTERTDVFEGASGRIAIPVMGTFECDGGLITAWRDYFDPRPFLGSAA